MGNFVAHGLQDRVLDIVDGQQRLTTTLILLSRVRDRFVLLDEAERVAGIEQYISSLDDDGAQQWRLSSNENDSYLVKRVFPRVDLRVDSMDPKTDGDHAVAKAASIFDDYIEEEISEKKLSGVSELDALAKIRDWALNANVVHIRLADRKAAFDIFETLNDRGKSLTPADLVKTLIVSILTPKTPLDKVVEVWDGIAASVSNFATGDMTTFLRNHWNSVDFGDTQKVVVQRALRKHISRYIEEDGNGPNRYVRAENYVSSLEHSASLLGVLDSPLEASSWAKLSDMSMVQFEYRSDKISEIGSRLYFIKQWGYSQAMPLLICILRKYIPRAYSPSLWSMSSKITREFLDVIDVLEFRWKMANMGSTSTHRDIYRKASYRLSGVSSNEGAREALNEFREEAQRILPSDAKVRDGIKQISYRGKTSGYSHSVRVILSRVNGRWGGEGFGFDTPYLTIEHVKGQRGLSATTNRNLWLGRLGNLMLIPQGVNSRLPEKPAEKVEELSPYVAPEDLHMKEFINDKEWGAKIAQRRLVAIAECCVHEIWTM